MFQVRCRQKLNKNLFLPLYILYSFKRCICVCACAHGYLCKCDKCAHIEARGHPWVSSVRKAPTSVITGSLLSLV